MKKTKTLLKHKLPQPRTMALFIVAFAALGAALVLFSRAATRSVVLEAETSTLSGSANVADDASASGGKSVRFGVASSPDPDPDPGGGGGNAGNPTGQFYIVGKDIIDPDGNIFYPIGANVGVEANFSWRGTADGRVNDALEWGWNTIRLTMYCTDGSSWTSRSKYGYQGLLDQVDGIVQEYTSRKIVVMIECHDPFDNVGQVDQFWTDMAKKYKSNTYVWFNAANEPVWSDNNAWITFQNKYYDLVRANGAENIFVADALNAGNDGGWDGAMLLYDDPIGPDLVKGRCNVLLAMHAYGGTASRIGTEKYFETIQNKNLPLVIGELGYTVDGSTTAGNFELNRQGTNEALELAPGRGIGLLFWHGTHGDNYSLKNDGGPFYSGGSGSNLSPAGQKMWDIGHNPPNLGSFSGSYGASNCASAQ